MLQAVSVDFRRIPGIEIQAARDGNKQAFQRQSAAADFTLVIAPELHHLLQIRCSWAKGPLLGSTLDTIQLTADKLALSRFLSRHAVPTPPTFALAGGSRLNGSVVVKPRFGAGSLDTYLAPMADAQLCRSDHQLVVQPFVPGLAASVAWLSGPKQQIPMPPASQRLSRDGRLRYLGGQIPLPRRLAKRAIELSRRAILAVPGLGGYVGVDLVLGEARDGSEDSVIEINPRLTTSYLGLRHLCKDNLAEAMLRIAQGLRVPPLRWRRGTIQFASSGKCRLVSERASGRA